MLELLFHDKQKLTALCIEMIFFYDTVQNVLIRGESL